MAISKDSRKIQLTFNSTKEQERVVMDYLSNSFSELNEIKRILYEYVMSISESEEITKPKSKSKTIKDNESKSNNIKSNTGKSKKVKDNISDTKIIEDDTNKSKSIKDSKSKQKVFTSTTNDTKSIEDNTSKSKEIISDDFNIDDLITEEEVIEGEKNNNGFDINAMMESMKGFMK